MGPWNLERESPPTRIQAGKQEVYKKKKEKKSVLSAVLGFPSLRYQKRARRYRERYAGETFRVNCQKGLFAKSLGVIARNCYAHVTVQPE